VRAQLLYNHMAPPIWVLTDLSLVCSLVEGGLGCALWDGSIVLSRWIYLHKDVFGGRSVLELGAGCGLPGLMAAKYAKKVVLTEYVQQLVDNITYNIELNSSDDGERTPHTHLCVVTDHDCIARP